MYNAMNLRRAAEGVGVLHSITEAVGLCRDGREEGEVNRGTEGLENEVNGRGVDRVDAWL